ncbi:MAG: reverse transcriptase domain-containing protein [Candidatus Acidiferrum sp.]
MRRSDCHLARATWGARCGKSARRVLRGGTRTSDLVARPVPTHHNIDQNLLMRAVKKHAKDRWNILYIERWLKASMQEEDGRLVPREKGTPQGGVASPLLANLFLHYAFDRWLATNYPQVVFERFADDVIVHCRTEREALAMRKAIAERLQNCGLELHPEKTKIAYCKDDGRRRHHLNEKFDFLGYTFRARSSMNRKGKRFVNFSPAISAKAAQAIRTEVRSWRLPQRSDQAIEDLSRMFNPIVRGWLQYYGRYYRSALYSPMRQLDRDLTLWAAHKYQKLRKHLRRASHWLARIRKRTPALFAHWQLSTRHGSAMGAV